MPSGLIKPTDSITYSIQRLQTQCNLPQEFKKAVGGTLGIVFNSQSSMMTIDEARKHPQIQTLVTTLSEEGIRIAPKEIRRLGGKRAELVFSVEQMVASPV